MESVPPNVGFTEERATNVVPVGLSVGSAGDSITLVGTANWPASLGDPDWSATSDILGDGESILEEVGSSINAVGLGVLEVWVFVNTEPVQVVDDLGVGAV